MKKATLLTFLFAILMVALLVSCADPADPLPDETTTDMAVGDVTTADPAPPENVTAGSDITTEEPTNTTEAEVTTEPIVCETETSMGGYGISVYMNPLTEFQPSDGSTVKITDTEPEWHITEWETANEYIPPEVPDEKQGLAFRVPQKYEGVSDELKITVEFFEEYVPVGAPMQVRVTIENRSTSAKRYKIPESADGMQMLSILKNGDRSAPFAVIDASYFPENAGYMYRDIYGRMVTDVDCSMNLLKKGAVISPPEPPGEIGNGNFEGSVTLEYLMRYDPADAEQGATYELAIRMLRYDKAYIYTTYLFVPMEIVAFEYAPS